MEPNPTGGLSCPFCGAPLEAVVLEASVKLGLLSILFGYFVGTR